MNRAIIHPSHGSPHLQMLVVGVVQWWHQVSRGVIIHCFLHNIWYLWLFHQLGESMVQFSHGNAITYHRWWTFLELWWKFWISVHKFVECSRQFSCRKALVEKSNCKHEMSRQKTVIIMASMTASNQLWDLCATCRRNKTNLIIH